MPNLGSNQLALAQELKDQFKYREALETLSSIENVNELTVDDQISFYLLQSFLFYEHYLFDKALEAADWVFRQGIKTGNNLVMLDASLARCYALGRLSKTEEMHDSILKCEELIANIKDQPEKIIGERKVDFARIRADYNRYILKPDKSFEWSKTFLALSEKYGIKREKAKAFLYIGTFYIRTGDYTRGLENYENALKIGKEINDNWLIGDITYLKGWYYRITGQSDKFLECKKTCLALSEKYRTKGHMARAINSIGIFYAETGDFTKALENFEHFLKIHKELKNKVGVAEAYVNMGEIFSLQGDLDRALEYLDLALSLAEDMGHKNIMASILGNIGSTYYEKGELDKALNYNKRNLQLEKELGGNFRTSEGLFNIIPIYLDQNDLESAHACLEEIRIIRAIGENPRINQRFFIAKALILKKIGGNRNVIRAEDILKNLLEEKSVENPILVIILLNLCELLYMELQATNETDILEEIPPLITRLFEIAEKTPSFSLLAEVYLFKAKLEVLNLELEEAQRLLTQAQQITQQYHLSRLEKKISMEHDQFLEKLDIWKELKKRNAPLSERLKRFSLEDDLNLMMRKKEIEQVEILPEEPQLLSIISRGGISLFMHFFSKEWEKKLMFGSFMTAFNSFSHEFFAKTLDRVKIGENTIIMTPFEDKFLCYVIKGQTYPAQQKLKRFSEEIKDSQEILEAINYSFISGVVLDEENTPLLGELVNSIFV